MTNKIKHRNAQELAVCESSLVNWVTQTKKLYEYSPSVSAPHNTHHTVEDELQHFSQDLMILMILALIG